MMKTILSMASVIITLIFRLVVLNPILGNEHPLMLFLAPVVFSAWYFRLHGGMVALTTAAGLATCFVTPNPTGLTSVVDLGVFLVLGVATTLTTDTLHTQRDRLKRKKELIAEQNGELMDFFHNAPIGIHWVDANGTVVKVNKAELEMLGYSEEEYVGRQITDFHCDQATVENMLMRLLRNESLDNYPAMLKTKDGQVRHVLVSSNACFKEGKFDHTRCFTRDVTEIKRVADEIEKNGRYVRTVLDTAPVLIGVTGNSTDLGFVNRTWCEYFGKEINGWLGRVHPDDASQLLAGWNAAIDNKTVFRYTCRLRRHDGEYRWMDAQTVPFVGDEFNGCTVAFSDITEQKVMEERLRHEHRMKDEFLATLAHELRNPLAPILTGLQILQVAKPDSDAFRKSMSVMERQVRHMTRLIDDLLDVSRITRGRIDLQKERVAIAPIIDQVVDAARPLVEGSAHKLVVDLPEQPVYLHADQARIVQAVSNLLTNSAKYTRNGGEIRLKVAVEMGDVVIEVKDNGLGIPPERIGHIFDLFVQLDRSLERASGGLGIGLTLVRKLIEMHGGTVTAASPGINMGSVFTIRLPLADGPIFKPAKPVREVIPVPKKKVLIVDDNADAATSLAMLLELHGHAVKVANDGKYALRLHDEFRPDVIVQDIGMPGMSGFEVCQAIRKKESGQVGNVLIVALTGYGQEEDRRKTTAAGFDFHLTKPLDLPDLTNILEKQ